VKASADFALAVDCWPNPAGSLNGANFAGSKNSAASPELL
jgi:hypothetical protein